MTRFLLLVDHENVHETDFSPLHESCQIIVYVGAAQNTPKAARNPGSKHRFERVNFVRVEGGGKNALDFYIACQLGRVFETERATVCFVLSKDTGYDPLLRHLSKLGLACGRVASLEQLPALPAGPVKAPLEKVDQRLVALEGVPKHVCEHCRTAYNVALHGGRWCFVCGSYTRPPAPEEEPEGRMPFSLRLGARPKSGLTCAWCHQTCDMAGGIYDDGEWMCGDCVGSAE